MLKLGGLGVVNVRLKIKAQRVKFITILLSGDGDGLWKSLNVRLKIKAQRVKFITILLSGDGDGLWKSLAEHFIGKYKNYNINTDILKCKIINRKVHFKTMPIIYR